jgi:hypothetical protein
MNHVRKWWKLALAVLALVVLAQITMSVLVRTNRVHHYLLAHLERSFGRTVEVGRFHVLLLPRVRVYAERVSIGEDPEFGNEYFLRADYLTASLRWTGLLRGHFEFGTLALSRPSLNLVRNTAGSWNLERWLPPAKSSPGASTIIYGPPSAATPANRLQKIDVDDGRINFKLAEEKLPFAFTGVSGSVDQISPGRWQLRLAAEPWRSGVTLQSTGTVVVLGDVAGTSARLQPAEISVHWAQVSLADMFRLFRGYDYGVRGVFSLDCTAKSATAAPAATGEWTFSLHARAAQIHRWDLTERADNPSVNLHMEGHANVPAGTVVAEQFVVETAKSNVRGTAQASSTSVPAWGVEIDSAGIQAADLLAWYRAFRPGMDNGITAEQFFSGVMTLRGWPLQLQDAAFSSAGGEFRFPGLNSPVRFGVLRGGLDRGQLTVEPVHVSYAVPGRAETSRPKSSASSKRRSGPENRGAVDIAFTHDLNEHAGHVSIDGHVDRIEDVIRIAAQSGWTLNRGWELTGAAAAALRWEWQDVPRHGRWNGHFDVTKGELQVAGLNQPLHLNKARMQWQDGLRGFDIEEIEGFGALWSGTITQKNAAEVDGDSKWNFKLHADHLDAAELDRWVGPRARPGWLQRLLLPIFGGAAVSNAASELLRRVNAEGQLSVDQFTIEKLKLNQLRAEGTLRDLQLDVSDAEAQWSGGKVHAKMSAAFSPQPSYEVAAELDHVNLAQLPAAVQIGERLGGAASATLHLTTQGVGRDELLQHLAGAGEVSLRNVEFRGWDVNASVADGAPRPGASRWQSGAGSFTVRDREIVLPGLRLETGHEFMLVKGTVSFAQDANLTVQNVSGDRKREVRGLEPKYVLKISGPLDLPHISVAAAIARQPAD